MKAPTRNSLAPVRINGAQITPQNAAHRRKLLALQAYVQGLLAGPARPHIAKIILFGSVARGQARPHSDIDVMVLGFDHLDVLRDVSYDAILELGDFSGEGIEPLFETVDEWVAPQSYFTYRVTRFGKEVYSVPDEQIKREEASDWLMLARDYVMYAEHSLEAGDWRAVSDLAYNAAELCAKGVLLFKIDDLPGSHGGTVAKFGEHYIKAGPLARDLGRRLSRGLEIRNWARYKPKAILTCEMAQESLALAKEMISHLDAKLKE